MPLKTQQTETPSINLTAMIDVVFLLLIFLLVAAKFHDQEREMALELPQVAEDGTLPLTTAKATINVRGNGEIYLEREPVTLAQLSQRLRATRLAQPQFGVLVRGDAEGRYQRIAEVLGACRTAGIREVGVSVHPLPGESPTTSP